MLRVDAPSVAAQHPVQLDEVQMGAQEGRPAAILAIDFGTSNTSAAMEIPGMPIRTIRLATRSDLMPSAVMLTDQGYVVGEAAVRSAVLDPLRYEPFPKRRLIDGEILLGDQMIAASAVVAEVLKEVIKKAERQTTEPISRVVLTHPDRWGDSQIRQLRQAARIAGIPSDELVLISEARAAAWHYASESELHTGERVAVVDCGAGTCDVAIIERTANGFDILAADGLDGFGGNNIDAKVWDWVQALLKRSHPRIASDLQRADTLRTQLTIADRVREAKEYLSEYSSAPIGVSDDVVLTLTRRELDATVRQDLGVVAKLAGSLIDSVGLPGPARIYLTGGTSQIPLLHSLLQPLAPIATLDDPKTVVARGAIIAYHHLGTKATTQSASLFSGPVRGAGPIAEHLPSTDRPPLTSRTAEPAFIPKHQRNPHRAWIGIASIFASAMVAAYFVLFRHVEWTSSGQLSTTEPPTPTLYPQVRTGECLNWNANTGSGLTVISCTTYHLFEFAALIDLAVVSEDFPPGTPLPSDAEFGRISAKHCPPAVQNYLGRQLDPREPFSVGWIVRDKSSWASGSRHLECGIEVRSPEGALEQFSGRVPRRGQPLVWKVGTCAGIANGRSTEPIDNCSPPHSFEVVTLVSLSDEFNGAKVPSIDDQERFLDGQCAAAATTYTGLSVPEMRKERMRIYWDNVSPQDWNSELRMINCKVGHGDGDIFFPTRGSSHR